MRRSNPCLDTKKEWIASSQTFLAMTVDTVSHSRDALRPSFASKFSRPLQFRGRRECRMRAAPAISCAVCTRSARMSIQVKRRTSDIPCAVALRLITCSPRRTALLPPLRPGKLLPPGALTPAPRRQDHTSLPYALMPFAIGTASVHRDPPHDRGDHDTPLWSGRDGLRCSRDLDSVKQNYFRFEQIFALTLIL